MPSFVSPTTPIQRHCWPPRLLSAPTGTRHSRRSLSSRAAPGLSSAEASRSPSWRSESAPKKGGSRFSFGDAPHHADLVFGVTTGLRFHPGEIVLSMVIKLAAALVLGAAPVAVLVVGVVAPRPWGGIAFLLVAGFVAWLLYLTWTRLTLPERLMRAAVLVLALAVALVKLIPS